MKNNPLLTNKQMPFSKKGPYVNTHYNDPLNLKPLEKDEPVTVYRVEVDEQAYANINDAISSRVYHQKPKFPHIHLNNERNVYIYQPKPTDEFSKAGSRKNVNIARFKPTKHLNESRKEPNTFLQTWREQGRNDIFLNFGNLYRALEFYYQKSCNELALNFVIKSFKIPHKVWLSLMKATVHEKDIPYYFDRPYNVDRKVWNQLGLKQRHIDLINKNIIPHSGRILNPIFEKEKLNGEDRIKINKMELHLEFLKEVKRLSSIEL